MASACSAATVISMRSLLIAGLLALSAAPQEKGHRTLALDAPSGAFTSLHYGPEVRVPYLWPVRGPGGVEMTRAFPVAPAREGEAKDHPHHTSMWLAHGDVNGHDFWHSKGATPRVDVLGEPKVAVKAGVMTVDMIAEWIASPGEALLREKRRMTLSEMDGVRHIDVDVRLEALVDVTFGDTKEGTFALRLHPALRLRGEVAKGKALDSEGRADRALWGKRSRWLAYHGPVAGEEVGVAIFDHPKNPRHPTWWHARDYGLVGANPFGVHDFEKKPAGTGDLELEKGEVLRMRYRVRLYSGATDAEALEAAWRDWSGQSASKGEPQGSDGRDS